MRSLSFTQSFRHEIDKMPNKRWLCP